MEIPKNIPKIIKKIEENKKRLRLLEAILWRYCLTPFKKEFSRDASLRNQGAIINLPNAEVRQSKITKGEIYTLLGEVSAELPENHLIRLCSLFENLINEILKIDSFSIYKKDQVYQKILGLPIKIKRYKKERLKEIWSFSDIESFFKDKKTEKILSGEEMKELKLIYLTRNNYIHRGGLVDSKWIKYYEGIGKKKDAKEGELVRKVFEDFFPEVEKWNGLIIEVSRRIENRIKEI